MYKKYDEIYETINTTVRGKEVLVQKILAAIFAGGNLLMDDIPGVGKTTLALCLSKVLGLQYKRVQFTPDVLPGDITGFSMYRQNTGTFEYQEGAAMTNLLLADEINRTSPKTQSALLEIMEEKQVTVDGITHPLPNPFIVIATQNPFGSSGTQMLPESQLDRFMLCVSLGYPDHINAVEVLKQNTSKKVAALTPCITIDDFFRIQTMTHDVFVQDSMYDYLVRLTEETRRHPEIALGASPRATAALLNLAKGIAFTSHRDYLIPKDVTSVFCDVMGHRIRLKNSTADKQAVRQVLEEVLSLTTMPHLST